MGPSSMLAWKSSRLLSGPPAPGNDMALRSQPAGAEGRRHRMPSSVPIRNSGRVAPRPAVTQLGPLSCKPNKTTALHNYRYLNLCSRIGMGQAAHVCGSAWTFVNPMRQHVFRYHMITSLRATNDIGVEAQWIRCANRLEPEYFTMTE